MTARICDAFLVCIERNGLRTTSIDDVAVEAGCGRATIYRVIPGGRAGILLATVGHSLGIVIDGCREVVAGAESLDEAVARSLHVAATLLEGSAALQRLLAEEPGAILPYLSFDGLQPLLDRVAQLSPALFGRFGTIEQSRSAGDWTARVVLAHLRSPGGPIDLTDIDACRRLVDTFFTATDQTPNAAPSAINR
jgi:AcrR family transcriptional regulator